MRIDSVEVDDEREFEPLTGIHHLDGEVPELDVDGLAARTAKCPDIQRRELGRLGVGAARTRDGTARETSELCQRLRRLQRRIVQVQGAIRLATDDRHVAGKTLRRCARERLARRVAFQMNLT